MGKNQGLNRLSNGVKRKVTASEVNRGYLFISKDKSVEGLLGEEFDTIIYDQIFKYRSIDSSGRIYVGREIMKRLKNRYIEINLDKKRVVIK